MEAQHTPGPWISHKAPSVYGGNGFVIQNEKHRGITIASLFPGATTDRIEPVAEANARLIAAAPEGFDLIEQLEESFTADGVYQQFLPAMRAYLAKVGGRHAAAIAKATGEI